MQIIETNLKFNGTGTKRRSTTRVIIHHSVSGDVSAATIHGWHLNNKWMGIGYHFVIRANGSIERGRAEGLIGAHAGEKGNPDSIGVCLVGDFTKHPPAEAQLLALVDLIHWLRSKHGNLAVIGHKDVMATACPGYMFPWAELHKRLEVAPAPAQPVRVKAGGQTWEATIIDGRSYTQVRQLAEALGHTVTWDDANKLVIVD